MTQHRPSSRPRALAGLIAGLLTAALAGPAAAQGVVPFDEAAALAAARNEPPITIYDSTGKIVDMVEACSELADVVAQRAAGAVPERLLLRATRGRGWEEDLS